MSENNKNAEPTKVIHVSRSLEPQKQEISPELEAKHKKSSEMYPDIDLSESEYVLKVARRHPIGLLMQLSVSLVIFLIAFFPIIFADAFNTFLYDNIGIEIPSYIFSLTSLLLIACAIGVGAVSFYVFKNNKLYLTNESVIQRVQISLFSKQEQSVSLGSIEDSSYKKSNILQTIFNYGDVRLSTVGDETTYRLSYVSNPKEYMSTLDHAVEAFKNGRPITDSDIVN